ncbi:MAG: amidohydrolase [Gammaproteobacteria bacterium]|nr:MAG: amidohydrolase [Gammaproteobacteria bacterium]
MMRVDAHQHFWRYHAPDYAWMGAGMDVLRRDWLPTDLHPLLARHEFDACIAVQARQTDAETDFLLELAHAHSFVAAVIGWVDLRAPDLQRRLERWRGDTRLAGFRHLLQDEADVSAWLADAAFNRGVSRLQQSQQVYEVLVHAAQLADVPAFCARHDEYWLVLDHLGKPAIGGEDHAAWRAQLEAFAPMRHVLCKLSGLVTEVRTRTLGVAEIEGHLDIALDVFGEYADVVEIVARWAEQLSLAEQGHLFGDNAVRCYSLQRSPAQPGVH